MVFEIFKISKSFNLKNLDSKKIWKHSYERVGLCKVRTKKRKRFEREGVEGNNRDGPRRLVGFGGEDLYTGESYRTTRQRRYIGTPYENGF